jgi:hypothetical protein
VVEETWAKPYRFAIPNGIRVVELHLKKHIPSHFMIVGQRVLVSYDGQPLGAMDATRKDISSVSSHIDGSAFPLRQPRVQQRGRRRCGLSVPPPTHR